jgi:Uncharacterised nucleotidyltransferase
MNNLQSYYFTARSLCLEIPKNKDFVKSQIENVDWSLIVKIANNHLILPSLYSSYQKNNMLDLLPGELTEQLQKIHAINTERNQEILEQVEELNVILNKHDIYPLYTKGVAHLLDELYENPGDRIMIDIDLLVGKELMEPTAKILMDKGYFHAFQKSILKQEILKHYPRIIKEGRRAGVEIHHSPVRKEYAIHFGTERVNLSKRFPKTRKDCYVLSDSDKLIHNFIHSQIEHKAHRNANVYLKNLHDFYLLSRDRACPVSTFEEFGHYKRASEIYRQLVYNAFQSEADPEVKNLPSHSFYHFRFRTNMKSKIIIYLSYFLFYVPPKVFRHYFQKPFLAIYNKEVRKHLLSKIRDPRAYRKHFASYKKIFIKK